MSTKQKHNKQRQECTYNVKGMHCASCEVLIEKKIIKQGNVKAVDASTSDNKVVVEYEGSKLSTDELNKLFKSDGYSFSEVKEAVPEKTEESSSFKYYDGQFSISTKFINSVVFVVVGLLVVYILYKVFERFGLASLISVNASSALPAFFFFGIAAGFSSCAALVGGIVLSMSKQWYELHAESDSFAQKIQPHLLFNVGRVISFGIFGGVLGAIGSIFSISPIFTAIVAILVAIMMVFMGLQMLGFKAFQRFQFRMPKSMSRYIADESNFSGRYMPFLMGALTFFLPCGFTITAQGLALVSGNPIRGALMMALFALGTSPMLLFIGMSSTKLYEKAHVADNFMKLVGVLIIIFGLSTVNLQLVALGLPNLSDLSANRNNPSIVQAGGSGATQQKLPEIVDGKQVVKMNAGISGYEPNTIVVKTGVPVKWEITNTGASGCTNALIARGLFSGQVSLGSEGETVVKEFTPTKAGKYRFSCWMGMVSGVIEVVDAK